MITAETVNGIVRFNGNGLPVVSLYARVPAERQGRQAVIRSQVDSLLHDVRPMAEDRRLGRDAMLSIRGDIERIDEVSARSGGRRARSRCSPAPVAAFSRRCC